MKSERFKSKKTICKNVQTLTPLKFIFRCSYKENHSQPLFGVSFNPIVNSEKGTIFCTVGGNNASIYLCQLNGQLKLLTTLIDDDAEEIYYCSTWTFDTITLNSILILGGLKAVIRIVPINKPQESLHLLGHGYSINDLKIHPHMPNILLSASKDHSLRLWNIRTKTLISIFSGVDGHRDEDFNHDGSLILSSGMDHSLKIWNINTKEMNDLIEASNHFKGYGYGAKISFPTLLSHFPILTTRDIHKNYVDSSLWHGNVIFSKSCENIITCWKFGVIENVNQTSIDNVKKYPNRYSNNICLDYHKSDYGLQSLQLAPHIKANKLFDIPVSDCDLWFIRMNEDPSQKYLALGNCTGKIFVWDLDSNNIQNSQPQVLKHSNCKSIIRQVCFSPIITEANNKIENMNESEKLNNAKQSFMSLIGVCDDSTIWRWDIQF
ncbi:polycomb protein esc-like isoform X2 [Gordionus sp. m RMFG-2023]|uniref:polycomb protein esc-like isoform X2 n=1 Tax=Gordionus sp. m RMFG-2023 TaxID=3053472 RepID=UPI0031FD7A18